MIDGPQHGTLSFFPHLHSGRSEVTENRYSTVSDRESGTRNRNKNKNINTSCRRQLSLLGFGGGSLSNFTVTTKGQQ